MRVFSNWGLDDDDKPEPRLSPALRAVRVVLTVVAVPVIFWAFAFAGSLTTGAYRLAVNTKYRTVNAVDLYLLIVLVVAALALAHYERS